MDFLCLRSGKAGAELWLSLVEMGLIARDGRMVGARPEVILAFLPLRRKAGQRAKTG